MQSFPFTLGEFVIKQMEKFTAEIAKALDVGFTQCSLPLKTTKSTLLKPIQELQERRLLLQGL